MSLCDSDTKKQVEASTEYSAMLLDSMNLLRIITKLVYARGTNNLNVRHNKAMAHINLMTLSQEKIQDIQEFRDHYMAMRKVCHELCQNSEDGKMTQGQYSRKRGSPSPQVPSSKGY